jgi:hypothetical protein
MSGSYGAVDCGLTSEEKGLVFSIMETILIGIIASFVMFVVFFAVFLLRGRGDDNAPAVHSCGRPKGQCHCSQAGKDTALSRHAPPDDLRDVRLAPGTVTPSCSSRSDSS